MRVAVKAAVVLVILVGLLSVVTILTGIHANPVLGGTVSIGVFILFNLGVVFWALRQTRDENGYGGQVLVGVTIGLGAAGNPVHPIIQTAVFIGAPTTASVASYAIARKHLRKPAAPQTVAA